MTVHSAPTFYLEYRGYSQEVDTLHLETVEDPDKRFEARFKHTPLDEKQDVAYGPTAEAAIADAKYRIETADWKVHYEGIMARMNAMQKTIDELTAQQQQPASPSIAP